MPDKISEEQAVVMLQEEKAKILPSIDPMAEVLARLKKLEEENLKLKSIAEDLAAKGVEHLMTGDPNVRSGIRADVARSVTIATRPVRENPEQYAHVVNPNDVAQRGGN